jgi:5-methylcytosine-specific restriction endonuclease McrA
MTGSFEEWAALAGAGAPIECRHANSRLRKRTLSNGSIAFIHQCTKCGISVGQPIARDKVPDVQNTPPWDDTLQERVRQRERESRETQREEWRLEYAEYLRSQKWSDKRQLVLRRAGGICEGCLASKATQVHHLTYDHVFDELLFELVAICDDCHDRAHGRNQTEGEPIEGDDA